jgi:hypothetical protein
VDDIGVHARIRDVERDPGAVLFPGRHADRLARPSISKRFSRAKMGETGGELLDSAVAREGDARKLRASVLEKPLLGIGSVELRKNSMNRMAIIKEFFEFLRERKKWWIAPILFFLVLLGIFVIFASSSTLAPFIYSLF